MNEQLQQALTTILTKTMAGVEAGISFLSTELPEVIQQLLLWKLLEAGVTAFLCTVMVVATTIVLIKFTGPGKKKEGSHYHQWTLTHDELGQVSPHLIIPGFIAPFVYGFGVTGACSNLMTALQIWVAPKIYLIEYAASLAK